MINTTESKPLRVLFVNRMACLERGGGETFDLEISRHLAQTGTKVTFLSGAPFFGPPLMPLEGAKVLHTPWLRRFPWDKVKGGWRVRQFEFEWFEWRAARWIQDHANEFDMVQICELPNLVYWLKKRRVKVPVVMRLTAPNFHDPRGGVTLANAVIASGTTIQKLHALGQTNVVDIPNAVDANLFHPQSSDFRQQKRIGADEFVSIYVARFQAFKNHDLLIRSFAHFLRSHPKSRLLLAGSGPLRERTGQLAAELGIAPHVLFLDEVPYSDLPAVYAAADVNVISSDYESFCFAALEAMAMGLPVLTTDCAWVPRLVEDGAGMVVPVGNASAFAAALCRLADNPALRQRMGATGRQQVLDHHTWPASAEKLLGVYETILGTETVNQSENANVNRPLAMKTKMGHLDVLFVVSPAYARSAYAPLYYLYLAGYLEKKGFSVGIVDPHEKKTEANVDIIIREIKFKKPRYVGLATFVTDYDVILALAKKIKSETGAKIIAGNAHPSVSPHDFLYENSPFDLVVRGEGELTLKQVLEEYDENRDNSHIKGIAYLHQGRIQINSNREFMDLGECGMPAYHMIDMRWIAKPTKSLIRRVITSTAAIQTSRGCPYNCSFCAANAVWKAMSKAPLGPPLFRKRPIAHVIEELGILQNQYQFDFFYILDDTFGMTENDIVVFCDAYRKSGLKMLWAADTRVNCIRSEKIVMLMKNAGCIQLDFGVETGSPKLLQIINKRTDISEIENAFSLCRKHGIRTFANMLVNLPGETEDDLNLSHQLLRNIQPTCLTVAATQPYPGTSIHDKYLKVPIPKEQYWRLSRSSPREDYRMAEHNTNFDTLLQQWWKKYGISTPFDSNIFKVDGRYWMAILRSRRKLAYLIVFLNEIVKKPISYYVYLWLKFLKCYK